MLIKYLLNVKNLIRCRCTLLDGTVYQMSITLSHLQCFVPQEYFQDVNINLAAGRQI
jgi:hypothetical protein